MLPLLVFQDLGSETIVRATRESQRATDTAADVVVVTREELEATNERSLPRQLAEAAGVWVQETNLGGGSPIIQGLSGNQVLLIVDGVRLNDSTTRNGVNQMLNGIDPATVERIEVIRGPRSVLYGSDALGGVVLVWTRSRQPLGGSAGSERTLGGELGVAAQSVTDGIVASAGLSGAWEDHGVLGIGSHHDWEDLRSADGVVDHTGYDGRALFGSWIARFDEHRALRTSAAVTQDFDVPRTDRLNTGFGQTQPANSEFDFAEQDRRRVVLAYEDTQGHALCDSFQARSSFRTYDEQRVIRAFNSNTRRLERDETSTLGVGLDLVKNLGERHVLVYGVDADYDDVDSSRVDVDLAGGGQTQQDGSFAPDSRFLSTGVFVQDEWHVAEDWDATLGARYGFFDFGFRDPDTDQKEDGSFDALSGSAALAHALNPGLSLVGTLATGFRAPNLAELAREASFFGGTELPNADLDPERSLYTELALEHAGSAHVLALALFRNRIDDAVSSVLIDPGGPDAGDETYLRENVAKLTILGASARGQAALGGVDSPWSGSFAVDYTYGEQESDVVDGSGEVPFDEVPAQRIPPLTGWLGLERAMGLVSWERTRLTLNWAFEQDRLSPQDLGDPRIDPSGTDGWVTLDLDLAGRFGALHGLSWTLGVSNLLDEDYRMHGSGFDAPGFGVAASVWYRP